MLKLLFIIGISVLFLALNLLTSHYARKEFTYDFSLESDLA